MNKFAIFLWDLTHKNTNNSEPLQFNNIQKVLILTSEKLSEKELSSFPYTTFLFISNNDLPKGYQLVNEHSFNWLGKNKDPNLQEILEKNYDLFINYKVEQNPLTSYLYRLIHSKVTLSDSAINRADVIINNTKNQEEFLHKMNQTIHKIQKKI